MNRSTALALDAEPRMLISSDLLGPLEVDEADLFDFPHGIFGFPDCHGFVLLAADPEGMYWLQSAEHSALAFLLVDPFPLFDGYLVDLEPADRAELRVEPDSRVAILAIVRLPSSPDEQPTANLQGPLALNLDSRLAKQLVLSGSDPGVRRAFTMPTA